MTPPAHRTGPTRISPHDGRGTGAVPSTGSPRPIIGRIPPSAYLDLKRLATLVEVGRCGSYAAAAEALSFTPSAISQQMSSLARDLDVVLFERTPGGMRLTQSAEVLVAHAEDVFAKLAEAQAALESIAGGIGGRLRVGSFPSATVAVTAGVLNAFRDRHPRVQVRFADGEPYESVRRLTQRELDLAVVFGLDRWTAATDYDGRPVCADVDIDYTELFDDPYDTVLPRAHPLAESEVVELSDLDGERILGSPPACCPWGPDLFRLCAQAGVEPELEPVYRTVDFRALEAIVATGRGITLVPRLAQTSTHPGTVVRPLVGGPVRHVAVATLSGLAVSPACRAMINEIVAATASSRTALESLPEAIDLRRSESA